MKLNNRSVEDDVEVDDDSATSPKMANRNAMNLFNFTNFNSPNFHMQYDYTAPIARNTPENNQVRLIDYRNQKVASFTVDAKELICLPQAFEFFLKALVGGLHTVYTKLKRLDIVPIVCNVEQVSGSREVNSIFLLSYFLKVRVLRSLGAIQPGVNRCKLISPKEFDVLYEDCTNSS